MVSEMALITVSDLDTLSVDALRDIGLSRSDLPSVSTGQFFSDHTRRQR